MVRSYIDFTGGMVVQWSNFKFLTLYWSPYVLNTFALNVHTDVLDVFVLFCPSIVLSSNLQILQLFLFSYISSYHGSLNDELH